MNDIADFLRKEIVKRTSDPETARLLIPGLLAELTEELQNTDWPHVFAKIEEEIEKDSLIKKTSKRASKRIIPDDLPPGTMNARDFYDKHGVSYSNFRRHTEQGINGDFLDVTEIKPYPDTRPNYKDRYLTPSQQAKAIEYWDTHHTPYKCT